MNNEPVSDIAVFCRVVEVGSFTATAEALELSKGAVSKYVSRLEARLGARLLNRTTRRLTLTEAGEAFYQRASVALAELREAEQSAGEFADRPRGHLRVSAPAFYGAEILSRQVSAFRHRYPDITLDLILDNRFVDLVEERIDVAIRMSAPKDSSLVMRKLAEVPVMVCAAPAYLEARGLPRTPEDLQTHECLIYTISRRPYEWTFVGERGQRYVVAVNGSFRCNDDHALRQAALDGCGVIAMPELFLTDALASGALVPLFPPESLTRVTLALVYPSRRELPAKVRTFVDFISAGGA